MKLLKKYLKWHNIKMGGQFNKSTKKTILYTFKIFKTTLQSKICLKITAGVNQIAILQMRVGVNQKVSQYSDPEVVIMKFKVVILLGNNWNLIIVAI